jgi:hypothetical protein
MVGLFQFKLPHLPFLGVSDISTPPAIQHGNIQFSERIIEERDLRPDVAAVASSSYCNSD